MLSHDASCSHWERVGSFVRLVQEQELFQKDQSRGDMYTGLPLKAIIPDNSTN